MRAMRVPRSGSMILTMFVALLATALLPIVFMAALAASAEAHPRPMVGGGQKNDNDECDLVVQRRSLLNGSFGYGSRRDAVDHRTRLAQRAQRLRPGCLP